MSVSTQAAWFSCIVGSHATPRFLSALKKAEDSDEVILRLFETTGETTKGEIEFFQRIKRATFANLLEEEEQELTVEGNKLTLGVKPFQIVTLKLKF